MGSLLSGMLASAGQDVRLVERDAAVVRALTAQGLTLVRDGVARRFMPPVSPSGHNLGPVDGVLVCVKSYHTRAVCQEHRELLANAGLVITLQNGVGNGEILAEAAPLDRLVVGVTSHGAYKTDPCTVVHGGVGDIALGLAGGGDCLRLHGLATTLNQAGLNAHCRADVQSAVWEKLCVNAGINALSALLQQPNGFLLAHPALTAAMDQAVSEAVTVAGALGIPLDRETMVARTRGIARDTARNRSSMCMDLLNGRPTEVDAINGAIIDLAQRHGLPAPINQALCLLVKLTQLVNGVAATGCAKI